MIRNLPITFKRDLTTEQEGKSQVGLLVFLLVLLGVLGLLTVYRQAVLDWWRLRDYQAPARVAQIATQDSMTDYARKVFYVNHPSVADKQSFSDACPNNGGEQTIVLGCYHSPQNGIYLLNVTDSRLSGVVQVTAAHEMLHAAYDRMNSSDRQKVDAMLLDYYHNGLTDPRIKKSIDAYKVSEPNDIVNEMHSIFGTEVSQLPAGLEQHYKQYFSNRAQIAAYAAQYQNEFTSRQAIVAQDDAQLTAMKAQIKAYENELKQQQAAIASKRNDLTNLRNSGKTDEYNAAVPGYNSMIDSYNSKVEAAQSLISQYNQLVARRNAVALEEHELANDLNANVQPIQQ